jgi:hypothetical protein
MEPKPVFDPLLTFTASACPLEVLCGVSGAARFPLPDPEQAWLLPDGLLKVVGWEESRTAHLKFTEVRILPAAAILTNSRDSGLLS